jgi:hypothetical protein
MKTYNAIVDELLAVESTNDLGPGRPNEALRPRLAALSTGVLCAPHSVSDHSLARACLAGLWLFHDFLDESHGISQEIHTPTGSFWHGIMHRREPDYGNSKYWFQRVGRHPVFAPLAEAVAPLIAREQHELVKELLGSEGWAPFAFVDLCEAAATGRLSCVPLCRQIQRIEWELLFDHCYRQATGR